MPEKTPPPGSGTSTRSRGKERSETVRATGSSDATIIVSVRNVLRPTPASTPRISTLIRPTAGVAVSGRVSARRRRGPGSGARRLGRGRRGSRLPGSAGRGALGEHVVRALAHRLGHDAGVGLRGGHEDDEGDDRQRHRAARSARQPSVGERRAERKEPPTEERGLEDEQRGPGRGRRGGPPRARPAVVDQSRPAARPARRTSGRPKIAARRMRPATRCPRPGTRTVSRAGT